MTYNFNDLKIAVKNLGGDTNDVILDDLGYPSIMVRIDKMDIANLITGATTQTHPAFIVDGEEIASFWYSKYINTTMFNRAYSLPNVDPKTYVNFDQAKNYCEAKGEGWHLGTNAEWAAIALWCKANGCMPRGNNYYGKDHNNQWEKAVPTYEYDSSGTKTIGRTATGSGPLSWNHDNKPSGICDMNGNVYEWVGGLRLNNGEIQIIQNNNAAKHVAQNADSTLWKAIKPDGTLVSPGTSGTLKYDYSSPVPAGGTSSYGFRLNTSLANPADNESAYGSNSFASLASAEGVSIPMMLKSLALMPGDSNSHGSDRMYIRNIGEKLSLRGGRWYSATSAGDFCLYLNDVRTCSSGDLGFRSAFIL